MNFLGTEPTKLMIKNNLKTNEYMREEEEEEEKNQDELAHVADLIQWKMDEDIEPTSKISNSNKKRGRIISSNTRHYKLYIQRHRHPRNPR